MALGADPAAGGRPSQLVARVLVDVAGVDREFDYSVPAHLAEMARPGTIVRVPLHGRRVRGWVTVFPADAPEGLTLLPVERVVGWGPEPAVVDLVPWAAWRWSGRRRSFLVTGSPLTVVPTLQGAADMTRRNLPATLARVKAAEASRGSGPATSRLEQAVLRAGRGTHVLRLPPASSATELVLAAAARGPVLVLAPTKERALSGATTLRRRGAQVALLPGDWALARAGTEVVVGTRGAAWGPCPGLASVLVLDAHDESYVQEQAPTWGAAEVASERAKSAGVPCFWVSPCPTLEMLDAASHVATPGTSAERRGWAPLLVADQRGQDPRLGLYSKMLVELAREGQGRLICVLNRKGRAVLLSCGACGELATCENCGGPVALLGESLTCHRCGAKRPVVCRSCASDGLRIARPGISRVREQLEALAGRPTAEVLAGPLPDAPVLVGTEAILYREADLRRAGMVRAVAFLDFDQELQGARYRAGEEALALLARASRLVGGRQREGRVLVQTRVPGHAVISAAQYADPGRLAAAERPVRKALRLPPYAALAVMSGPGAAEMATWLTGLSGTAGPPAARGWGPPGRDRVRAPGERGGLEVAQLGEERFVVRANSVAELADALSAVGRPAQRVRVEVGPPRF